MGSKESIRKKSKKCSDNINSFCGNVPFYFNYFLYPLDTWRKVNVHKTLRNRPGRFLNILKVLSIYVLCPGGVLWETPRFGKDY